MEKVKQIVKKWWFFPAVGAYLLFGVWFGSLNYRVFKNGDNYLYLTRLVLYPVSTILNEGLMCSDNTKNKASCAFVNRRDGKIKDGINLLGIMDQKQLKYQKGTYNTITALFWPIKIVFNFTILVLSLFAIVFTVVLLMVLGISIVIFYNLSYLVNFLL